MKSLNYKALGVIFLALALFGVWSTYAVFTKKFTDYEKVTLQTSNIGLQLPERADVKIRGVQVGEVLEFDTTSEGATLTLGIYPDQADTIPNNVTGLIEPKTLFGEKQVSLVVPDQPSKQTIRAGDVIERTKVSIEVEKVLGDIYPLLRTVQPAEINMTLNALATALEGRGELIGENLTTLDSYLKRINPLIPDLVEDLTLLADTSDLYSDVLPEIATVLRNTVKTGNTLKGREVKLKQLFQNVSAFSDTAGEVLDENEDNLIRLGDLSAAQLRVLAKYAPEYTCLLGGIVAASSRQAEAFRGFTLHINLELLPNQPRGYDVGDKHVNGAKNGPHCGELPVPSYSQKNPFSNPPNINDGVERDTNKGTRRVAPSYTTNGRGYVGSAAEATVVKTILAPALGTSFADVPDLGVLLFAPMARGAEVSSR